MLAIAVTTIAQSPNLINYQGVARDNGGNVLANQNIGVLMTIHQTSGSGPIVTSQSHSATTNDFGLFTIQVGGGTMVSGSVLFENIDWSAGPYFLEVSIDASGGTNYTSMGTSQLLSVPYALHAENAWSLKGNEGTNDGVNFIGTTDDEAFIIKVNNEQSGKIGTSTHGANTFLGYQAGKSTTTGGSNIAIGYKTLDSNTEGERNTSVGGDAMGSNTTGSDNTAIGYGTMLWNSVGESNTAIGRSAMYYNETGWYNTAVGANSLRSNEDGWSNTAVGFEALYSNTFGTNNTVLGTRAGFNNSLGSGNVFLGQRAGYNETGSDKLYIDNSDATSPLIYGEFDTDLLAINGTLRVNDGTQADGSVLTSDASGNASWQAPVTATYGEYVLGSTVGVTSTTYTGTGISVTLPSAGTYRVCYSVRLDYNQGTLMQVRLYNNTAGLVVANSTKHGPYSDNTTLLMATDVALDCFITVTEASTIELQAKRSNTTNPVNIYTDGELVNKLTYMKVGG